jgi:hypothetical protein
MIRVGPSSAPARKQVIGDGIPNDSKPHLVADLTFLDERHDALPVLSLSVVEN